MDSNRPPQIHRLSIFDEQQVQTSDYALIQVTAAPDTTWPLHIEATEGQSSYHTKVSRHDLSSLREKKNQKSKDEWESIVRRCLLRKAEDEDDRTLDTNEIEMFATLAPQELSIIVRKKIGEVKQRLGEIPVRLDEEHEVDVLGWCHTAVDRGDTLASEHQLLQSKFSAQQTTISELNKQLEDLIAAKKEHESTLMAKFCEILNTKKLKIRDQQRLLATVKVDQVQAAKVRESRDGNSSKAVAKSKKGKRKAAAFADEESEGDDDEAFGAGGELKAEAELDSEEEEGRKTDEGSDHGDATTDDESDTAALTTKSLPHDLNADTRNDIQDVRMDDLPPVRELPFGKNEAKDISATTQAPNSSTTKSSKADGHDDDETTDDDEL